MQQAEEIMKPIVVSALYYFVQLKDLEATKAALLSVLEDNQIRGTLILANEGINGTVSGSRTSIDSLYQWFKSQPELNGVKAKESFHDEQPFYRTKVKIKQEIVTMGVDGIDPQKIVGTYVKPADWNDLISDPDVTLIDTRNDYEFQIGSFEGAINPITDTFREFPQYVAENLDPAKQKKVAMFCTGGIRCEKSTAYLKEQGFEEVYHLEGGILKYLEEMPQDNSKWNGQCFVFDNRVSVGHELAVGDFELCHACRKPLSAEDRQKPEFEDGICCHHCVDSVTDKQRERYKERQKQAMLAKSRGEHHIGHDAVKTIQQRREQKMAQRQKQRQLNSKKSKVKS
jgi:UPF0176 protein